MDLDEIIALSTFSAKVKTAQLGETNALVKNIVTAVSMVGTVGINQEALEKMGYEVLLDKILEVSGANEFIRKI